MFVFKLDYKIYNQMKDMPGRQVQDSAKQQQSYDDRKRLRGIRSNVILKKQNKPLLQCVDNQKLSYIFILTSTIFLVGGYMFSNKQNIDPIQTNFIRFLTQTIIQVPIMYFGKYNIVFKNPSELRLLIVRGIIFAGHAFAIAFGQYYLPLTVVFTLNSSGIIFILVLNYLIYRIKINQKQFKALVYGILGILLTITGRFIYHLIDQHYKFQTEFPHYRSHDKYIYLIYSISFMLWMAVWAFSLIYRANIIKSGFNQNIFLNSIIGLYIYSLLYLTLQQKSEPKELLILIATTGLMLTISNYFFSWGLHISTNIGLTSILNQFTVIVSYIISILIYQEQVNYISLMGNLLIIGSIYVILIKK